jgi:hypothetical protein
VACSINTTEVGCAVDNEEEREKVFVCEIERERGRGRERGGRGREEGRISFLLSLAL